MPNLWGDKIPFDNTEFDFTPEITAYPSDSKGAVIVFAGGGFEGRSGHEGPVIGEWFQRNGITAFVVDYRTNPYRHPAPLSDAMRAVRVVRFYADKYGYDCNKIAVMGFSAGGHLAGSVSVHCDKNIYDATDHIDYESARPDMSILCYPVIDMGENRHDGSRINLIGARPAERMKEFMSIHKQVNANTPEAFIWHTATDEGVDVMNSLLYAEALSKENIPYEMHIYPMGGHGLGLSQNLPYVGKWADNLMNYLSEKGWR